jgi:lysozyme
MIPREALSYIANNEGSRSRPYICTAGKLTIGRGRNLDDKGLSPVEIEFLFQNDISDAFIDANTFYSDFNMLDDVRKTVILDMVYQLGLPKLLQFKKFRAFVIAQDYKKAAAEILDSKYAKTDTPSRAYRNSLMMEKGEWVE